MLPYEFNYLAWGHRTACVGGCQLNLTNSEDFYGGTLVFRQPHARNWPNFDKDAIRPTKALGQSGGGKMGAVVGLSRLSVPRQVSGCQLAHPSRRK
jgi:hypothetical protein